MGIKFNFGDENSRVESTVKSATAISSELDAAGPTWDGYHVVEWLHHRFPEDPVPFIVISGGDPAAIKTKAQSLGAFGYLPKPVDKQILLDMVKQAIGEAPAPPPPSGSGAPPPLPPRLPGK